MVWIIIILVIVIVAISKNKWISKKRGQILEWPFYAKKPLTTPEQVLYFRLCGALPNHIVLSQVQLSQFLAVKKGWKRREWINRVNRLSADFVICNRDARVIAVIELNDSSHERPVRINADTKKAAALKSAGIRLITWWTKTLPDTNAIEAAIKQVEKEPRDALGVSESPVTEHHTLKVR